MPRPGLRARASGVSLILAIETSTSQASLALVTDDDVVFEAAFESDRHHHSLLFAPLEAACRQMGTARLSEVVVGTGPGSYSGTRVGIAAGQGVAMFHGCSAVGLSSLLATGLREGMFVGDARRGSAWWARVGKGLPEPQLIGVEDLRGRLEGPVDALEELSSLELGVEVTQRVPTAVHLARAWRELEPGVRETLRSNPPQPAYLRPPHITEAKPGHPLLRGN